MTRHDFIMLFFVITLAVTSANLLSTYLSMQFFVYNVQQAADARALEYQKIAEQRQRIVEPQQEARKKQRASSKKGQTLWYSCADWTAIHQQKPTRITEKESKRQCRLYHEYLQGG